MAEYLVAMAAAMYGEECVVASDSKLPPLVDDDGLRIGLHRWIYRMLHDELPPYLVRTCSTEACVQPRHYVGSNQPYVLLDRCRNGHAYTGEERRDARGTRICQACRDARNARRRTGGVPRWVELKARRFCSNGHEFTHENTYTYPTPSGGTTRKCRTCVIARAAGLDPAAEAA